MVNQFNDFPQWTFTCFFTMWFRVLGWVSLQQHTKYYCNTGESLKCIMQIPHYDLLSCFRRKIEFWLLQSIFWLGEKIFEVLSALTPPQKTPSHKLPPSLLIFRLFHSSEVSWSLPSSHILCPQGLCGLQGSFFHSTWPQIYSLLGPCLSHRRIRTLVLLGGSH